MGEEKLPSPASSECPAHPRPVSTLPTWFSSLKVFQHLLRTEKESHVFLKSLIGCLGAASPGLELLVKSSSHP